MARGGIWWWLGAFAALGIAAAASSQAQQRSSASDGSASGGGAPPGDGSTDDSSSASFSTPTSSTGEPSVTSVDLNALDDSNSTLTERVALFMPYFSAAESQYQMPPGLLLQQGIAESRLIPGAQSSEGAVGIMQMLPRYYPNAGVDALADIESAAQVDAGYYRRFGDWALALAAYNAGPTAVANAGNRVPAITETRNYVSKILGPLGLTPSQTLFA